MLAYNYDSPNVLISDCNHITPFGNSQLAMRSYFTNIIF